MLTIESKSSCIRYRRILRKKTANALTYTFGYNDKQEKINDRNICKLKNFSHIFLLEIENDTIIL